MGRLVEVEWCSRPRLGWAGLGGGAGVTADHFYCSHFPYLARLLLKLRR